MENIQKKSGKIGIVITLLVVFLLVIIVGSFLLTSSVNGGIVADSKVVATVNGEEVLGEELNRAYTQFLKYYESQNIDFFEEQRKAGLSKSEAKKELVSWLIEEELISRILIVNYAKSQGYVVTEEQAETSYNDSITQAGGEKEFLALLAENNVTTDEFRKILEEDIIFSSFITERFNSEEETVSDEEIQLAYNQYESVYAENGETAPALEEIRNDIVLELKGQKVNQKFMEFYSGLRNEAQVEILI